MPTPEETDAFVQSFRQLSHDDAEWLAAEGWIDVLERCPSSGQRVVGMAYFGMGSRPTYCQVDYNPESHHFTHWREMTPDDEPRIGMYR